MHDFLSTDKPHSIPLRVGGKTLATAHPNHPPTKRTDLWAWRMLFRAKDGKWRFRGLGRLPTSDVAEALIKAYRDIDPAAVGDDGSSLKTLGDLLRAWYHWQEQRGPGSQTRPENQIAHRTLLAYRTACVQLVAAGDSLKLKGLTQGDLLGVRDRLAEQYSRER